VLWRRKESSWRIDAFEVLFEEYEADDLDDEESRVDDKSSEKGLCGCLGRGLGGGRHGSREETINRACLDVTWFLACSESGHGESRHAVHLPQTPNSSKIMRGTVVLALLPLIHHAAAFYLPGSAPRDYKDGETVELFVNALTPKTNVATPKLVRSFCLLSLFADPPTEIINRLSVTISVDSKQD
jgi:hypothetical protein